MKQTLTYFSLLGISEDASQEELEARYRELADYLASPDLPAGLREWARSQAALVDEAYAVLADPEHRSRVELRGLDRARVDVDRALRRTRGARRVQPEAGILAGRRRGLEPCPRLRHERLQREMRAGIAARHDDMLQERRRLDRRLEPRQERRRHHEHARPAVPQHELVVRRREERVHRDRDDAGLDRAEEHARPVDRVQMHQHDPVLHLEPEPAERVRGAIHALRELGIGIPARIVYVCELAAPAGGEIALDQVVRGVVLARDADGRRAHAVIRGA